MSPSDPAPPFGPRSGVTLLEVLISLAILALIVSVAASRLARPDRFAAERVAAKIAEAAAAARLRAITEDRTVEFAPEQPPCPGVDAAPNVIFHPDGTVAAEPLCLLVDGDEVHFQVDPLTGRLTRSEGGAR